MLRCYRNSRLPQQEMLSPSSVRSLYLSVRDESRPVLNLLWSCMLCSERTGSFVGNLTAGVRVRRTRGTTKRILVDVVTERPALRNSDDIHAVVDEVRERPCGMNIFNTDIPTETRTCLGYTEEVGYPVVSRERTGMKGDLHCIRNR